ncbi:SpoIIE family protein phosphatase [Nocardioides marinquilinus]|uniref:SpoIIE family protein phosphatase n=1 Tax=Nocardioides marinquilinus TaxID=1210400 RepID=A0ABP9PC49_9ACTN
MAQSLSGVLLVEDDEGDALLVRECLREAGLAESDVVWRRTVHDGVAALDHDTTCVLLDLGLPDAQGLDALHALVAAETDVPVIVLTGRHDRAGVDAVAGGAQDYLVKDDITPELLDRTIRYAVERRRTQLTELQLREERLLSAENSRLERGLLPRPMLRTPFVMCVSHYRPGRAQAVLGGDFFDVVETADGRVRAVVGDVMGHGPDEAAVGVHLRVAWRALVLAGAPDDEILDVLARLLEAEGGDDGFATLCDVTIDRDLGVSVRVAGHPPPLLCEGERARYVDAQVGPPVGLRGLPIAAEWPVTRTVVRPGSSLLLFTDGLLDAYRRADDVTSIGADELAAEATRAVVSGLPPEALMAQLVRNAPVRAADDTAVIVLTVADDA